MKKKGFDPCQVIHKLVNVFLYNVPKYTKLLTSVLLLIYLINIH